ncbi:unnamed protein product [Brugia timori]|uniref:BLOC-1-related complex subunit 7 n=1 Tax=Brugia timori TaxID=42155 RepID=A0A0R3Q3S8_9BILA|nr:unnamed protein product [Brugia timori]
MTSILNSVTVLTYLKSSVMMTFTDANNVRNGVLENAEHLHSEIYSLISVVKENSYTLSHSLYTLFQLTAHINIRLTNICIPF